MNVAKEDIPAEIDSQPAIARHQGGFGDASDYGNLAAEYFSLTQGTDITELLKGLENDHCQSPHWGYVISGKLTVTYTDGSEEVDTGGDMYYWPPGHTVRAEEDTDVVMFSPQREHGEVINHMRNKMEERA
jgi:mannose-6-phosphate isomerase-like protein (cupin superfamily)